MKSCCCDRDSVAPARLWADVVGQRERSPPREVDPRYEAFLVREVGTDLERLLQNLVGPKAAAPLRFAAHGQNVQTGRLGAKQANYERAAALRRLRGRAARARDGEAARRRAPQPAQWGGSRAHKVNPLPRLLIRQSKRLGQPLSDSRNGRDASERDVLSPFLPHLATPAARAPSGRRCSKNSRMRPRPVRVIWPGRASSTFEIRAR